MDHPFFSVVIPVYNTVHELERCVGSITEQTCRDFEIVLVDDGSRDGSGELCDALSLKDNRIKVIHKENGGGGAARKTGIDAAEGKYIMFMDNDDFYFPDMCNTLLKNIIDHNADISSCSYLACDENNNITHNIHNYRFIIYDNALIFKGFQKTLAGC